ncbi:MAG: RNA-guided pseudouridylation complex pseudouridine synthase subunit Cbf5 [Candidatus Micrarchaeota archaeon]
MDSKTFSNTVIIIDKPPGQASHEITTFVKKITGASRAGHAGTLDPEVSGVLPVALGKATKLLRYIAGKDKTYVGIVKFRKLMEKAEVEALFKRFTGELVQTPPKISAVRKAPRKRTVHHLKLLELDGRLALFETRVDAGTYIRTLCEDMGKECGGAAMVELRRTAVGKIEAKEAHKLTDLIDAIWLAREKKVDDLLRKMLKRPEELIGLPRVWVKESAVRSISSGAQVMAPAIEKLGDAKEGELVALYSGKEFLGVGVMQVDAERLHEMKKGMAIKLERIHKA